MRTNRHVPWILGIAAIAGAVYFVFAIQGFWGVIGAGSLLAFGVPTLKTALFASDKEIRELTTDIPLGEDTKKNFEDRI